MSVNPDAFRELKDKLEFASSLRIELVGSDLVQLEIVEIKKTFGREVTVTVKAVDA